MEIVIIPTGKDRQTVKIMERHGKDRYERKYRKVRKVSTTDPPPELRSDLQVATWWMDLKAYSKAVGQMYVWPIVLRSPLRPWMCDLNWAIQIKMAQFQPDNSDVL